MTTDQARIVVGIDGSAASVEALRWGLRIAPTIGASIEAVMAWDMPVMYGWNYLPGDYHPGREADKSLTETVDAVVGSNRPVGLELAVVQGNPAKVLLDRSRGAQMLIVGSRGHGGFAGLLLGSVSSNCAEHATCPVLVVHGAPPAV